MCGLLLAQVRIMKDWDPTGKSGPKAPMPDVVTVHQPKEEDSYGDKGFIKDKEEAFAKQAQFEEPAMAAQQQQPPQQQQQQQMLPPHAVA